MYSPQVSQLPIKKKEEKKKQEAKLVLVGSASQRCKDHFRIQNKNNKTRCNVHISKGGNADIGSTRYSTVLFMYVVNIHITYGTLYGQYFF